MRGLLIGLVFLFSINVQASTGPYTQKLKGYVAPELKITFAQNSMTTTEEKRGCGSWEWDTDIIPGKHWDAKYEEKYYPIDFTRDGKYEINFEFNWREPGRCGWTHDYGLSNIYFHTMPGEVKYPRGFSVLFKDEHGGPTAQKPVKDLNCELHRSQDWQDNCEWFEYNICEPKDPQLRKDYENGNIYWVKDTLNIFYTGTVEHPSSGCP